MGGGRGGEKVVGCRDRYIFCKLNGHVFEVLDSYPVGAKTQPNKNRCVQTEEPSTRVYSG